MTHKIGSSIATATQHAFSAVVIVLRAPASAVVMILSCPAAKISEAVGNVIKRMQAYMLQRAEAYMQREAGRVIPGKIDEALRTFAAVDLRTAILEEDVQAKQDKAAFIKDLITHLDGGEETLCKVLSLAASSLEKTGNAEKNKKSNRSTYQFFARFLVPLLQRGLNDNAVKMLLIQAMRDVNQTVQQIHRYAAAHPGRFDANAFKDELARTTMECNSMQELKAIAVDGMIEGLKQLIKKLKETPGATRSEKWILTILSKAPESFLRYTLGKLLDGFERSLNKKFQAAVLPLMQKFLAVDDAQEKIEAYFTVFFWKSLVPVLMQTMRSLTSAPVDFTQQEVDNIINPNLMADAGNLVRTVVSIAPDVRFREGATVGAVVALVPPPQGETVAARLGREALGRVSHLPLSTIRERVEGASNALLGENLLYPMVGNVVLQSADLPGTVTRAVEIARTVIGGCKPLSDAPPSLCEKWYARLTRRNQPPAPQPHGPSAPDAPPQGPTFVDGLASKAKEKGKKVKEQVKELGEKVKAGADELGEKVKAGAEKIKAGADELGEKVKAGAEKIKAGAKNLAERMDKSLDKVVNVFSRKK